jgi:endoglucanase
VPTTFEALANVADSEGSTGLLTFDIQKYLDDGTGSSAECISSYITEAFAPASQWPRCHGRHDLLVNLPNVEEE